jgi:hypothetical protein
MSMFHVKGLQHFRPCPRASVSGFGCRVHFTACSVIPLWPVLVRDAICDVHVQHLWGLCLGLERVWVWHALLQPPHSASFICSVCGRMWICQMHPTKLPRPPSLKQLPKEQMILVCLQCHRGTEGPVSEAHDIEGAAAKGSLLHTTFAAQCCEFGFKPGAVGLISFGPSLSRDQQAPALHLV